MFGDLTIPAAAITSAGGGTYSSICRLYRAERRGHSERARELRSGMTYVWGECLYGGTEKEEEDEEEEEEEEE